MGAPEHECEGLQSSTLPLGDGGSGEKAGVVVFASDRASGLSSQLSPALVLKLNIRDWESWSQKL